MSENTQDIDERTIRDLYSKRSKLHWGKLRFAGSIHIISVMSFIGASIAAGLSLPQLSQINVKNILSEPIIVWSFAGFFISLLGSNLIYSIFCPVIIRKFSSLSDFYLNQLEIKKCQLETYPDDNFDASLKHVAINYINDLSKKLLARWISMFLFGFSVTCICIFIFNLYHLTIVEESKLYTSKHTVNFNFNKSTLTSEAKEKLDKITKLVNKDTDILLIKGHTDNIGNTEYNQKLSIERASTTQKYLTFYKELNDSNITIVGYGPFHPAAPSNSEDDRKLNRRVEIEIISPKKN